MIVDLRDYTIRATARDALIERCERLFFPEQERLGATILGSFRDAEDPTRLVWLRAAPDLATRQRVLTAFYAEGEMWRAHRDEVNGWIVDSDNVLLLRPLSEWAAPAPGPSVVGMYTHVERRPLGAAEAAALDERVAAAIAAAGGRPLVTLVTDPAENNYPKHPIRTGEHGLVWFASFAAWRPLAEDVPVERRRLLPSPSSRMR
jgi:hypothetical protein